MKESAEPEREPPHRVHCKSLDCPCYRDGLDKLLPKLRDAVEGMEEMLPYVWDYFREKWELDGYLERAKQALKDYG